MDYQPRVSEIDIYMLLQKNNLVLNMFKYLGRKISHVFKYESSVILFSGLSVKVPFIP